MKSFYLESCQKRNNGLATQLIVDGLSINFSGIYMEWLRRRGEGRDKKKNDKLIVILKLRESKVRERITES